jgi:hypothetical protein
MTISDEMRSLGIVALFLFFAVVLFGGFMFRIGAMVWGTPPAGVARGESWTVGPCAVDDHDRGVVGAGIRPSRADSDIADSGPST